MKFARDCRSSESNEATAQLLFEALPWIKNLTGKTVVIKYGGAAMVDEQLRRDVMSDIVLLKIIGMRPVIVHGGGKAINEALSHYDIPVEFKNGQRVTSPATMDIVREVLGGKVNQELVAAINHHGNLAVGVSGSDAGTLIAEPLDPELGRVGKVTHVNTDYIERLLDSEYIPVIATVAAGEAGGFFNKHADPAAGAVAAEAALPRAVTVGAGASALPRGAGCRRQQSLDGQCDLAIRCHIDDLHLHGVAVVQHRCNVLDILVGHLRNVDHAHAALRQRNECAKRLYAGDTAFKNIPYLNRQNSILLVD